MAAAGSGSRKPPSITSTSHHNGSSRMTRTGRTEGRVRPQRRAARDAETSDGTLSHGPRKLPPRRGTGAKKGAKVGATAGQR